jgi:hypothetical protein
MFYLYNFTFFFLQFWINFILQIYIHFFFIYIKKASFNIENFIFLLRFILFEVINFKKIRICELNRIVEIQHNFFKFFNRKLSEKCKKKIYKIESNQNKQYFILFYFKFQEKVKKLKVLKKQIKLIKKYFGCLFLERKKNLIMIFLFFNSLFFPRIYCIYFSYKNFEKLKKTTYNIFFSTFFQFLGIIQKKVHYQSIFKFF